MNQAKRLAALLVVLLTTVGCDQATKSMAQTHLDGEAPRSFLNGLFWLHYAENPGAFLSFGAALPAPVQRWVFTVAVASVLGVILYFVLREVVRLQTSVLIALALFVGGGLGNLIDRVTNNGRVIDFMHLDFTQLAAPLIAPFGFSYLRTGIFNVADMALMAGVALLLISNFRHNPRAYAPQSSDG